MKRGRGKEGSGRNNAVAFMLSHEQRRKKSAFVLPSQLMWMVTGLLNSDKRRVPSRGRRRLRHVFVPQKNRTGSASDVKVEDDPRRLLASGCSVQEGIGRATGHVENWEKETAKNEKCTADRDGDCRYTAGNLDTVHRSR